MTHTMLAELLEMQRAAFVAARPEPLEVRRDRLRRLRDALRSGADELAAAMEADFGGRSPVMGLLVDVVPALGQIDHAIANLARWARNERRGATFPLGLIGGRAQVRHEPKGVIGIVSPWNYPVSLCLAPLAQVLAAGNRAMLKPSEATPRTADLLQRLIAETFAEDEVAVVTGGPEVGAAFCALPFDHLVFTGSTELGRKVMAAAAPNLTPLTLELGGKSPVIVGRSADLDRAAERIMLGKLMNAGQTCIAPDYLLVPEEQVAPMVERLAAATAAMYPTLAANDDYTAIINSRHFERLAGLVADAEAKGATVRVLNPANEDFGASNAGKMAPVLLTGVSDAMAAMREEIFGPVLPVLGYATLDDALAYINARPKPLALYHFGRDGAEAEAVLDRTQSGGVTLNDTIFHIGQDSLPFGGIGPSGMGAYHGIEGFRAFSHARAVYRQPRWPVAAMAGLKPPYGAAARRFLRFKLGS